MSGSDSGIDSVAAWSQYWSGGRLSSCPGAADNNYSGPIATSWQTFFSLLPADCRLLDIACGNGALLVMAHQYASDHDCCWQLTGVDRAVIASRSELMVPCIELVSGQDMHAQPFADNQFDAVCSQYGIEYGRFPDNMNEALRLLKPGGRFQFLLHSADSSIAERARLQLQQIDLLLGQWSLVELLQLMLQTEHSAAQFAAAKQNFERSAAAAFAYLKRLRQRQDVSLIEESLQQLGGIWQVRQQRSITDSLHACMDAIQALQSLRQRLLDQQSARLDQQQAERWLAQARDCAGSARLRQLEDAGSTIGWCLSGSKSCGNDQP